MNESIAGSKVFGRMVVRVYSMQELAVSPFIHEYRQLYLQPEIEEQLSYEAGNAPRGAALALEIQMPGHLQVEEEILCQMVHRHFSYRQALELQQKKQSLRQGYKDLLIAFGFMLFMTFLYQMIVRFMDENKLTSTIRDSLVILGWVAFWRPAELLLYEWHPHKHKAALYQRLANMPVKLSRIDADEKNDR